MWGGSQKNGTQEQNPVLSTAPGAGAPSLGHGLLCGVSELEESLGSQTLFPSTCRWS